MENRKATQGDIADILHAIGVMVDINTDEYKEYRETIYAEAVDFLNTPRETDQGPSYQNLSHFIFGFHRGWFLGEKRVHRQFANCMIIPMGEPIDL